jgi:hypothetical protein
VEPVDLGAKRDVLLEDCSAELVQIEQRFGDDAIEYLTNERSVDINYPVLHYPTKVNSFNFDKNPEVTGVLQGIKGQYLIMDTGVINIRKFGGYEVEFVSKGADPFEIR